MISAELMCLPKLFPNYAGQSLVMECYTSFNKNDCLLKVRQPVLPGRYEK